MDKMWLVLRFLKATKLNDLDLHVACLYKLCPLLFSHDHPNYARYTTIYWLLLLNLDRTHPGLKGLLKRNGFSVNRSGVPTSRNAVDITIEQTINRRATFQMVGMDNTDSSSHKDIRKSEIQHSEADVRKAVDAISNFVNPLEVENKDLLYCISSEAPVTADVDKDLLSADISGNKACHKFIEDRLVRKQQAFLIQSRNKD